MGSQIAALFKEKKTIQDFREAMIALDSTFALEQEDLMAIGQIYCDRYPESYSKRNCQHVQIGYSMARICVIEKSLAGIQPECKTIYRTMFYNLNTIEDSVSQLIKSIGCEQIKTDYQTITAAIKNIESLIDGLPRGMIKEKFVGGLSVIYNVVYLFHYYVEKCTDST
jgi:hypothetical protein